MQALKPKGTAAVFDVQRANANGDWLARGAEQWRSGDERQAARGTWLRQAGGLAARAEGGENSLRAQRKDANGDVIAIDALCSACEQDDDDATQLPRNDRPTNERQGTRRGRGGAARRGGPNNYH